MSKETVGNRIKEARKAKKFTQKELARILDCSHTTVSKYEQGEIENMPRPRMKRLSEVLGVSPTILFELEENNEIQKKNDILSDIILKLREDSELLGIVKDLAKLDTEKRTAVKSVINAFSITDK